ncbi:MAG TPA: hypothetical protein H9860_00875 [Candidatus Gemmiger faecavium]|nr:hypothetical protein [Candidatus Gemmiger faecavium]
MELFQILFDLLMAVSPQFAAAVLLLSTLLFGFCSYVFFAASNPAGGIVFLVMALVTLFLLVQGIRQHRFDRRKKDGRKKQ